MKKTLAILLALIMSASVALVSCNNADDTADNADDDFVVDFEGGEDEGEDGSDEATDKEGNVVKPSGNSGSSSGKVQQVNDTVYALYNVKIRAKAGTSATSNSSTVLGEIPFKTSVARTEINGHWSKIKYTTASGATIEGYVSNQLITTNQSSVIFNSAAVTTGEGDAQTTEYPVTKLKASKNNYILRSTSLANGYPHTVGWTLIELGLIAPGKEVTILEISEDKTWAKIKVAAGVLQLKNSQGSYEGQSVYSTEVVEGYIPYAFLEHSNSGNTSNQPSGGNSAG
ncbi:MAG: hypothetical protein E7678_05755 [Ruminococcaceae bacterium]|nr:hypothetical protein [Oscillospiraceae bacterium]